MISINLAAVIRSDYPRVIRTAAQKLQDNGYMSVGTFLEELSSEELEELVNYCNAIILKIDTEWAFDSIVLLGEMLSQAEGTLIDEPNVARTANLIILLTFEDLKRKGQIEFKREMATLGEKLSLNLARFKDG